MRRWWWVLAILVIMSVERLLGWPCLAVISGVWWLGDQPRRSSVVKLVVWSTVAAINFAAPWWLMWLLLVVAWTIMYPLEKWVTHIVFRWWLILFVTAGIWWWWYQASLVGSSSWYLVALAVFSAIGQGINQMSGLTHQAYQLDPRFWVLKQDD